MLCHERLCVFLMVRVLLIDPPDFVNSDKGNLQLPLGLVALHDYLKSIAVCKRVRIVDLSLQYLRCKRTEPISPIRLLKESDIFGEYWDVIGITTHFTNTLGSLAIAKYLKRQYPKTLVIFGGLHATSCHQSLLKKFPYIDLVILGEGELGMAELCKQVENGTIDLPTIPNAAYLDGHGRVVVNPKRFLALKTIEAYDYSCIPISEYIRNSCVNSFWMESGRGCVFKCGFCISAKHWGNRSRYFSAKKIVSDLTSLKRGGIDKVKFTHDQFTVNKQCVREISEAIIEAKLDIEWGCYSRVTEFPFGEIELMAKAGCRQIFIGLESKVVDVQTSIKKIVPTEKVEAIIDACFANGIELEGNIILGFPDHDERALLDELAYCAHLKRRSFGRVSISPLELYPSTEFYSLANYRQLFQLTSPAHESLSELFSFRFEHRRTFWNIPLPLLAECFRVWATYFPGTTSHILGSARGRKEFSRWLDVNVDDLIVIHSDEDLSRFDALIHKIHGFWKDDQEVLNLFVAECAIALAAMEWPQTLVLSSQGLAHLQYDGIEARATTEADVDDGGSVSAHEKRKPHIIIVRGCGTSVSIENLRA